MDTTNFLIDFLARLSFQVVAEVILKTQNLNMVSYSKISHMFKVGKEKKERMRVF